MGSYDCKFDFGSQERKLAFHWKEMAASQQKGWLRLGQNGPNAGTKAAPREDAKAAFQRGERVIMTGWDSI